MTESHNEMSIDELSEMLMDSLASPVRQAVDRRRALCSQRGGRFVGSWLWDAELDGGGEKNAKGESAVAKAHRHEAAKTVCRACPEQKPCLAAARRDPAADGIYGGELITPVPRKKRSDGHRQDDLRTGLPVRGSALRREEDALGQRRGTAAN